MFVVLHNGQKVVSVINADSKTVVAFPSTRTKVATSNLEQAKKELQKQGLDVSRITQYQKENEGIPNT